MPELEDEKYVRELFENLYKARLRKLPESQLESTKSPDYEVLSEQSRVAILEVGPRGPWLQWVLRGCITYAWGLLLAWEWPGLDRMPVNVDSDKSLHGCPRCRGVSSSLTRSLPADDTPPHAQP
jgi:hypothetical protein